MIFVKGDNLIMKINSDVMAELSREYGDAFYLLDSEQFKKNFIELSDCFKRYYPNFNIAYSYKTNYTPKLCKIVNELGGYAEVVSEMELQLALKVGVEPSRIIWNGPIKNEEASKSFLLSGGTINIDSLKEALFIKSIAEETENVLNIGVRCNFDVGDGVVSRFGIDIDSQEFVKVLEIIKSTSNMHLINFQSHFAKRQLDYWPSKAQGMLDVIDKFGIVPERIDIGGGLFGKMEPSLKEQFSSNIPSYTEYANAVATLFAQKFEKVENKPELVIEPGSALVGDCMYFVGTIKTIKKVRGKAFASVMGSQKNISMAGINPPMEIVPMGNEQQDYSNLDFVGFTCIEGDVLYHGYNGLLACEDKIIIKNCGSYSLVMKPPFILPNFAVLDITGEKLEVIKNAENFNDVFHTFNF